ncbi:11284_t:CDS:10 [Paraglomus occultum]|uniref:11284_t:CDS:1 n=1 Tax=Paraglomus occultum TaxID=144539 RepID=A0A9N9GJX6_9GLOM|nr:11284_t:CDS:10 [Paraglomus occultum]
MPRTRKTPVPARTLRSDIGVTLYKLSEAYKTLESVLKQLIVSNQGANSEHVSTENRDLVPFIHYAYCDFLHDLGKLASMGDRATGKAPLDQYLQFLNEIKSQLQDRGPNFQTSPFNLSRAQTRKVSDNKNPKVVGEIWSSPSHSEPEDEKVVSKNQSQFVVDKLIPTVPKEFQTLCFDLWFLILQHIALCSEENAADVLTLLIMNMDFSGNNIDDDAVVKRVENFFKVVSSLPKQWDSSLRQAIGRVLTKGDFENFARTLLYLDMIDSKLESAPVKNANNTCIGRILAKYHYVLLWHLRHLLERGYDEKKIQVIHDSCQLLEVAASHVRILSSLEIIRCCDEVIATWFKIMSMQLYMSRKKEETVQWDEVIESLKRIMFIFGNFPDMFKYVMTIILERIFAGALEQSQHQTTNNNGSLMDLNQQRESIMFDDTNIAKEGADFRRGNDLQSIYASEEMWDMSGNSYKETKWRAKIIMFTGDQPKCSAFDECYAMNVLNTCELIQRCCFSDDENLDRTKMSIFVTLLNRKFSTNVKKRSGLDHYRAILPKNTNSERDLLIKRSFNDTPILWLLLDFISSDQESFRMCNHIVHSLLATSIVFWYSVKDPDPHKHPNELDSAVRIMNTMRKACCVPAGLNQVGELFPHISSIDIGYLLLEAILHFLDDNVSRRREAKIDPMQVDEKEGGEKTEDMRRTNPNGVNYEKRMEKVKAVIRKHISTTANLVPLFYL